MTTLHLPPPEQDDEERMRRALERSGRPRPARHFAQDGDVRVVRLPNRRDPAAANAVQLEQALAAERLAREQAEAALRHAHATVQALQTKLAHAEIALRESASREEDAVQRAEEAARRAEEASVRVPDPAPVREVRPRTSPEGAQEPEPVEWWVPGWREGLSRRR